MKKSADISVDAGTSHSNTKKRKQCKDMRNVQVVVKIPILNVKLGVYKDEEWRLFIDSFTRSLKTVLLHNTKAYVSIQIAYITKFKKVYSNMKIILEKIKYEQHKWQICGDFKVLSMLLE